MSTVQGSSELSTPCFVSGLLSASTGAVFGVVFGFFSGAINTPQVPRNLGARRLRECRDYSHDLVFEFHITLLL